MTMHRTVRTGVTTATIGLATLLLSACGAASNQTAPLSTTLGETSTSPSIVATTESSSATSETSETASSTTASSTTPAGSSEGGTESGPGTTSSKRADWTVGPAERATPLVVKWVSAMSPCPNDGRRLPAMVIYTDGTTLQTKFKGTYCKGLPSVTIGWQDPVIVRVLAAGYFSSPSSKVAMNRPTAPDLPVTTVELREGNRTVQSVSAHGLAVDQVVPDDASIARAALEEFIMKLTVAADRTEPWEPLGAIVTAGSDSSGPTVPQPSLSDAGQKLIDTALSAGADARCVVLSGEDSQKVLALAADKGVSQQWATSSGTKSVAIGVALPWMNNCQQ